MKSQKIKQGKEILTEISQIGKEESYSPTIPSFIKNDTSKISQKELTLRYFILTAISDQGPYQEGIRMFVKQVLEELYNDNIRILHNPKEFNNNVERIINIMNKVNNKVKKKISQEWADKNNTNPKDYSSFFYQSSQGMRTTDRINKYLSDRWFSPFITFNRIIKNYDSVKNYLQKNESTEIMLYRLKNDKKYGFGKAIGKKACNLIGKWIHMFNLIEKDDTGWSEYSYNLPFDTNIGRVLFRTGWIFLWNNFSHFKDKDFIQKNKNRKDIKYYLRISNLRRNCKVDDNKNNSKFDKLYNIIVTEHLKSKTNKWRVKYIKNIPNVLLLNTEYSIADLDNGLTKIGKDYCINDINPNCKDCPIKEYCYGYKKEKSVITNYLT